MGGWGGGEVIMGGNKFVLKCIFLMKNRVFGTHPVGFMENSIIFLFF